MTLFRELGKEELADELIEIYVQKNEDRPNLFSPDNHYVFSSISDPKIREVFEQKAKNTQKKPNLDEVLSKIVETDSWGGKDEEFLGQITADQYYEFFKSIIPKTFQHI